MGFLPSWGLQGKEFDGLTSTVRGRRGILDDGLLGLGDGLSRYETWHHRPILEPVG